MALAAVLLPWFLLIRGHVNMAALDHQLRKLFAANNPSRARKLLNAGTHSLYARCLADAFDACIAGDWPESQRIAHARSAFNDRFRAEAEAMSRRMPLLAVALAGAAVGVWAVADAGAPPLTLIAPAVATSMVLSVYARTRGLARQCPEYAERLFPVMAASIVAAGASAS